MGNTKSHTKGRVMILTTDCIFYFRPQISRITLYLLCHPLHQTDHTRLDKLRGMVVVGQPDECQQQLFVIGQGIVEQLFVQTEGLTDLTLDAITVYSVFEPFLRHTDEHLDWCISVRAFLIYVYRSQWKRSHRLATSCLSRQEAPPNRTGAKERIYQFSADHALALPEPRICFFDHSLHGLHGFILTTICPTMDYTDDLLTVSPV